MAKKFADFIIRNPWKTLLAGVLFIAALLPGLGMIQPDFSYRVWFLEGDPLLVRFDAFERRFGNDDQVVMAIHSPSGVFDAATIRLVQEVTEKLWLVPDVIRVDSLSNYNWVHAKGDEILVEPFLSPDEDLTETFLASRKEIALKDETIPSYLVSKDAKTAVLYATIAPKIGGTADYQKIVDGFKAVVDGIQDKGDHELYFTGNAVLTDGFREAAEHDMRTLVPVVLLIILLFLYFSFRNALAVGLAMGVIFLTVLTAMGAYGWMGFRFTSTSSVIPQILIAVGVAGAVHVLVTFLGALREGKDKLAAARYSLAKNFVPTFLTQLTTAIGFFSFASAKIAPISTMGIGSGVGTMVSWLLVFLVIGPALALLPFRVRPLNSGRSLSADYLADRASGWLERHSGKVIAGGALVAIMTVAIALKNEANSDPFGYFSDEFPLTVSNNFLEDHVGGGVGAEIVINSGAPDGIKDPAFLRKVEQFQKWVGEKPYVSKTVSIVDILKAMNRSLHGDDPAYSTIPETREAVAQLLLLYSMSLPQGMDINNRLTVENDSIRLTALWTLHESNESLAAFAEFERKAGEIGLSIEISGKGPLYQRLNEYVVPTFIQSLFMALILISVIMTLALKSVKLGLVSMIPNMLPIFVGGAMVPIMGKYLDVGTVVVASICLGIAVDDTIHFLVNYRNALNDGKSARAAVREVLRTTGLAMTATTLVLVTSFGAFVFADFVPNANFGWLVASVLGFALICDLLLLPALLIRLDGWLRGGVREKVETSRPEPVGV